jgi:NADH dehydrogenase
MLPVSTPRRPRPVIVGAGFAGLSVATTQAHSEATLIGRHNHLLSQPLLYHVATTGLSPADIASPIRGILSRAGNVHVMLAAVFAISLERREVAAGGRRIGFDHLILATGARHAYFGHGEWAAFAPGLTTIEDATRLGNKVRSKPCHQI